MSSSSRITAFSGQPFENLKALSKVEGLSANTILRENLSHARSRALARVTEAEESSLGIITKQDFSVCSL